MYHDSWWLLGDFTLEETKREEFTKDMELLLYKIGFRKKVEKEINGCSIPMVERVSVDEDGILTFDYNVMFPGEYVEYFINVRTSEYELGRRHGSWAVNQFCKLVAALLVYYSATALYLMEKTTIAPMYEEANILYQLLGKKYPSPYRKEGLEIRSSVDAQERVYEFEEIDHSVWRTCVEQSELYDGQVTFEGVFGYDVRNLQLDIQDQLAEHPDCETYSERMGYHIQRLKEEFPDFTPIPEENVDKLLVGLLLQCGFLDNLRYYDVKFANFFLENKQIEEIRQILAVFKSEVEETKEDFPEMSPYLTAKFLRGRNTLLYLTPGLTRFHNIVVNEGLRKNVFGY